MASTASAAFIIGGYDGVNFMQVFTTVAEFSQLPSESAGSWKLRGNLQRGRAQPKAITYSGRTLVIGGYNMQHFTNKQRLVFL